MFEAQFFARRAANPAKLLACGFTQSAEGWRYATPVMGGQFMLHVVIHSSNNPAAAQLPMTRLPVTRLIDAQTGEEYTLHKVESATGAFVGEVRAACAAVLTDIAARCFEPDVFRGAQTRAVIDYVRARYGDEPAFLWEKFPDYAVWRRADNRKWYGVIMTIPKCKLGIDSAELAEIIDLRLRPEDMAATVDGARYFPGWHMSKKSWYTMVLDGSVPTQELCRRIDESYTLAIK